MDNKLFKTAEKIASHLLNNEDEDDEEFQKWKQEKKNDKLFCKIRQNSLSHLDRYSNFPTEKGWNNIQRKLRLSKKHRVLQIVFSSAAVFVICLGCSLLLYKIIDTGNLPSDKEETILTKSSEVRLVLENGNEICLAKNFKTENDSCITVSNKQNRLTYSLKHKNKEVKPSYHEIIVPVGERYEVRLSDSTTVMLNTDSRLKFPNFFAGNTRTVEIEGEAYFKVTSNPNIPFIVKTNSGTVRVYGTEFNVSSYLEDATSKITLIKGSISVEKEGIEHKINPGEQWCYNKELNKTTKSKVDINSVIAWKYGKLTCKDTRLEDIMLVISHWYGVNINYEKESLKELRFGCNFMLNKDIAVLLRIFEANGKILINKNKDELLIKQGR